MAFGRWRINTFILLYHLSVAGIAGEIILWCVRRRKNHKRRKELSYFVIGIIVCHPACSCFILGGVADVGVLHLHSWVGVDVVVAIDWVHLFFGRLINSCLFCLFVLEDVEEYQEKQNEAKNWNSNEDMTMIYMCIGLRRRGSSSCSWNIKLSLFSYYFQRHIMSKINGGQSPDS